MAVRTSGGQRGLAEALMDTRLGSNAKLERIAALIDWAAVSRVLSGLRGGQRGAPPYPALLMFKALLLQQWYGLSDPGLEEALGDRVSFRRFVGLSLDEAAPDHATLWRFRQALQQAGMAETGFAEITRQLDAHGLVLRQGTLVDASLVAAQKNPPPPPGPEAVPAGTSQLVRRPDEPDADWTRRGKTRHFGYKIHIAADAGSLLVRHAMMTPASCNDTVVADALVRGDEAAVYADMAYATHQRRAWLRDRGIKPRLAYRPNRHHPLTHWQRRANHLIAQVRGRVETVFAILKRHYGHHRARYATLERNRTRLLLACCAFNLRRALVLAP
jgi:transposase, IS5 family